MTSIKTKTRREVVQWGLASAAAGASAAVVKGSALGHESRMALSRQEQITIEYWHINIETFGLPAVQEIVKRFQEQNPNIVVNEQFQTNQYAELLERVQTAMVGGNPPDVAQIGYTYLDYTANNFNYTSTEELVSEYGDEEFMANFPDNILELGQVDGKQVGMPYALSTIVTYYNADLLREAGVNPDNPPTTWDEWREAARAIYAVSGNPPIYIQLVEDNWSTQGLIESNGGEIISCEDGQVKAVFDQPQSVEAIQFWADLADEGLALVANNDQGYQAFASGNAAAYVTTIARRSGLEEQTSFDLRAAPFPSFGDKPRQLPAGGNCLFVFAQDEAKRQAAWEFIKFCESPEALTIWVEGTGYLPPRDDVADDPEYLGTFMDDNPIQQVGVDQLSLVVPWRSFPGPNGFQASKTLADAVEAALGGQQTAEDALGNAAQEANSLLEGEECL